jgi:hypothetical protein
MIGQKPASHEKETRMFKQPNPATASTGLWPLMVAAIGERIDSPASAALVKALGAKQFRSATPNNSSTHVIAKKLGIEVCASMDNMHRAYWPPRKEGRLWLTCISVIWIRPPYPGPLPHGLTWASGADDLAALGTPQVRGARDKPYWQLPAPRENVWLRAEMSQEKQTLAEVSLCLPFESNYITARYGEPGEEQSLRNVEDAFFAAWCALHGLLEPAKFTPDTIEPLRQRRITPLQFLHGHPCEGLLWSGDVQPQFHKFMQDYYWRWNIPESESWNADIKTVFGSSNYFRREGEAPTQDTWENYDRIAPHIDRRFAKWRAGA